MLRLSPFTFNYPSAKAPSPTLFSNQEISFPENGLWLISGPSGSGKSTLLSLIKGLSPYHIPAKFTGQIYYKDQLVDENFVKQKQNEIVYLFQNPFQQIIYQNPHLEFCFTAESQQISFEKFLVEKAWLEKEFLLADLWQKKTSELSLGQAQRLLLASLIASNPKVLLLDEPTAFLDKQGRDSFYKLLTELKKKFLIILVDHHLSEVKDKVDAVINVTDKGEVVKGTELLMQKPKLSLSREILSLDKSFEVKLENICFSYKKGTQVLTNVNFYAQSPDIVVLKGVNGSGKSTLLKILAGSLKPQKGSVTKCKDIGYVMQNPEENFIFDTAEEEIKETDPAMVNKFFSGKDLSCSPFSLSEGEKRRLSLLIHLQSDKKVILYDEPTFGLDEKNKMLVAQSLLEFKKNNILQIIVSHDEDFISTVADHIYELKGGSLEKL